MFYVFNKKLFSHEFFNENIFQDKCKLSKSIQENYTLVKIKDFKLLSVQTT